LSFCSYVESITEDTNNGKIRHLSIRKSQ